MADSDPPRPSATLSPDDLTGVEFGDYRVTRKLGQGGMGTVYLAEQLSLKRNVALKFLKPELADKESALKRFRAEAEAVARINHANIVQVYAVGEHDGRHFMALEYVAGKTLREHLERRGVPALPVCLKIITQVAQALQKASEQGIVHRDIKPENILVTKTVEVKVADFGLSRCFGEQAAQLTQTGLTMGTPLYMSPEQVQGKPVDPRTDIYSFGVTCYHLLAGEPPFRGSNSFEVALKHVSERPRPLAERRPDLPPALCDLVHRMMAKSPDDRPQSCREILRELAAVPAVAQESNAPPPAKSAAGVAADVTGSPESRIVVAPAKPPRWAYVVPAVALFLAGLAVRALLPTGPRPEWRPVPPPTTEELLKRRIATFADSRYERDTDPGLLAQYMRLGVLYLDQRRYGEAADHFATLAGPRQPPVVQFIGNLGWGVVLAHDGEAAGALAKFDAASRELAQSAAGVLQPTSPDAIDLLSHVVAGLALVEKAEKLPPRLDQFRQTVLGLLQPPRRPPQPR